MVAKNLKKKEVILYFNQWFYSHAENNYKKNEY